MSQELIFIIVIIILMFIYFNNQIKQIKETCKNQLKEEFANTINSDIVAAVTTIYQADIESIRNLSSFAKTLMDTNQIIIPANVVIQGNLTISGSLNTTGKLNANNDLSVGGSAQINGNLNTNGNAKSGSLTTGSSTINGNVNVNGSVNANVISSNGPVYSSEWFRVRGSGGIYWEDFGGGWQMTDSTYLRTFNNKNIYTPGYIQLGDWQIYNQKNNPNGNNLTFKNTSRGCNNSASITSDGGWYTTQCN